jgi:hypothetical protein
MELIKNKLGIIVLTYETVIELHYNKNLNNFIYNKNLISKNNFDAHSRIINKQVFGIYFKKSEKK